MHVFLVFQSEKSEVCREGLQFGHTALHARKSKDRHRTNQTGPDQRRFQKEPRGFHPVRPCKLRFSSTKAPPTL